MKGHNPLPSDFPLGLCHHFVISYSPQIKHHAGTAHGGGRWRVKPFPVLSTTRNWLNMRTSVLYACKALTLIAERQGRKQVIEIKILCICYKDAVTKREVCAKIQHAFGPHKSGHVGSKGYNQGKEYSNLIMSYYLAIAFTHNVKAHNQLCKLWRKLRMLNVYVGETG